MKSVQVHSESSLLIQDGRIPAAGGDTSRILSHAERGSSRKKRQLARAVSEVCNYFIVCIGIVAFPLCCISRL